MSCDSEQDEDIMEFEDEPTHVSVVAMIIEGENDSNLKWPFVGCVTITLLNQLENKNHVRKSVTFTSKDNGNMKWISNFISHSELVHDSVKNTQYLKNVFQSVHLPDFCNILNNMYELLIINDC